MCNSAHTSDVRGARPLLRDEVFHPVPAAFRSIDSVIKLRSDKLLHILNLSLEKLFLEEAISNYQSSKSALASALQEDMSGNIAMQLIHCWLLDAGQPIENMKSNLQIKSFSSPQCLSVIQIPNQTLLLAKNATGHHRLVDFPTFTQNVKTNLGLSVTIQPAPMYKILIWTGSELRFTDVETDEMVIGLTNPNVRLAQEIYAKTIKKEAKILQQLEALKEFAEPEAQRQKRSLLSWIFSANFGEKINPHIHHTICTHRATFPHPSFT